MSKLIIDLLSDTHNRHNRFKCEGGDILLHAGDCSGRGKRDEVLQFLDWYADQDYSNLIMIPGNHDFIFETNFGEMKKECNDRNITLLNDSGVTVEGIKIWGSPVQPHFNDWAFNRFRGSDIKKHWDLIPEDTEILITHGPPYEILDEVTNVMGDSYRVPQYVGCQDLMDKLEKTQVKLHVFGHIHEGRGIKYAGQRTYVNASSLDRMYCPASKRPIRATREIVQDGSIVYLAEE